MNIKDEFIKFGYNFTWFAKVWFSFTIFFSKIYKKCVVRRYKNVTEIKTALRFGTLYKNDNIAGVIKDYLIHPSVIECRLQSKTKLGDCDDHAIYWCVALKKSNLAKKVWFSLFSMKGTGEDKSYSAHAVCVFTDNEDKLYWCDYTTPKNIQKFSDFQKQSANNYGNVPICGAMWEVESLKDDDTPIFGKITRILPEKE